MKLFLTLIASSIWNIADVFAQVEPKTSLERQFVSKCDRTVPALGRYRISLSGDLVLKEVLKSSLDYALPEQLKYVETKPLHSAWKLKPSVDLVIAIQASVGPGLSYTRWPIVDGRKVVYQVMANNPLKFDSIPLQRIRDLFGSR